MGKIIKINEFQLKFLCNKILNEKLYSPTSKDNEINSSISTEDKKKLYNLIMSGNMDLVTIKIKSIGDELINKLGKENKKYIYYFLKRMAGAMIKSKYKI